MRTGESVPRIVLTLYARANCSLCEKAKTALRASRENIVIEEIDIDEDAHLRERFGHDVPVGFIAGREVFRHRVDPESLAAMIRSMSGSVPDTAAQQEQSAGERGGPSPLASGHCIPCRGGVPPLAGTELDALLTELGSGWQLVNGHLKKNYRFPDFAAALAFTNVAGTIAESEGHHPDLHLRWGEVRVEIWTHAIDGLTRSDFVLAAKIEAATRAATATGQAPET